MFGTNPIRHKEDFFEDGSKLRVQSIFHTIQGEGPWAGIPATFVRLAGCNLRCFFCDTDFESNWDNVMTVEQVLGVITSWHNRLVVLTGGEPMLQNISSLCLALTRVGYHVQIETSGTVSRIVPDLLISSITLAPGTSIVVSPKTPKVSATVYEQAMAWKYIITGQGDLSDNDGLPIKGTQQEDSSSVLCRPPRHLMNTTPERVLVQPCDFNDAKRNQEALAACIGVSRRFGYRISLQQHKILGLE